MDRGKCWYIDRSGNEMLRSIEGRTEKGFGLSNSKILGAIVNEMVCTLFKNEQTGNPNRRR